MSSNLNHQLVLIEKKCEKGKTYLNLIFKQFVI